MEIIMFKKQQKEMYVIINGLAYDIYKMPFYRRWYLKLKVRLGYRIDAL
jgi:hypothetical protein